MARAIGLRAYWVGSCLGLGTLRAIDENRARSEILLMMGLLPMKASPSVYSFPSCFKPSSVTTSAVVSSGSTHGR